MNQYCSNCGTRLNGEAFCPRCQKPTGANQNSDANPVPKPKVRTKAMVLAVITGMAIVYGVAYAIQRNAKAAPWREVNQAKAASDEEVFAKARQSPLYAAEWGWRLMQRATDYPGDTIPIDITQRRMDEAGAILLSAREACDGTLIDAYISHSQAKLFVWRNLVLKHPEISNRYWADNDFRIRVDSYFESVMVF